jgi:hypothetical protein
MLINASLEPLTTLCVDFVTGLPVLTKGNNALLTLTDKTTKFVKILVGKASYTAED